MADILSQSEIDELLRALADNEAVEFTAISEQPLQQVRDYDFKTANRFSKDNMRTFSTVFEFFSRLLTSFLSSTLRTFCEIDVESVEEVSFGEFTNSLPTPVILGIVSLRPLKGLTLIKMPSSIAYAIINRLFGGISSVNVEESSDTNKDFTEIDLVIIERVLQQFMNLFAQSWEKVESLQPYLDRIETNVQFAQLVPINEPTAVVTLNVKLGESTGLLNFCIPYVVIQSIVKKLNSKVWFSSVALDTGEQSSFRDPIETKLRRTPITLSALFNNTSATIGDVMSLQTGDVIRLDHSVKDPLTVNVEQLPKFRGSVGTYSSKYAIQVVEIFKEESEDERR